MNTYLFYDLETTGLNKAFDQILQFAAIRTDIRFNEIERYEFYVKLRPDIIPSPQATITHRISIAKSMQGICEFEAVQKIHKLINQPNTISIGYNNLNFDDEFLRFCFYRNLLSPYTHQYKNSCRRMDLLPIVTMYFLYKNDVFKWADSDGNISLQLDHLNKLNHFTGGQAHNAMVDVEATAELARRLFLKDSKMWEYLDGYFNKDNDAMRIIEMPIEFHSIACSNRIGLMVSHQFGLENKYQIPVLLIGNSIAYKKQTLWLRLDQESLPEKAWIIRKKYGEPNIVLPPHQRYWKHISKDREAIVEKNIKWLQTNTRLFNQIIQYHREFRYPEIENLDSDAALYKNGFLSKSEENLCESFHATTSIKKRIELVSQFEHLEMRQLASRILCRNYYADHKLPAMLTNDFTEANVLQDYTGKSHLTISQAIDDIDNIKQNLELDAEQISLLEELVNLLVQKSQKSSLSL
jgi:exodeoxyribonuclease-1